MSGLKQNLTRRLYALVPLPLESEATLRHRRRAGWGGFANCLACWALLLLLAASSAPAFLVTRVSGSGNLVALHYDVDVLVGDGLWMRGKCFGLNAQAVKDVLLKVGVDCSGVSQTANCWNTELTEEQEDHCYRFVSAQGLEALAISSLMVSLIAGTSNREGFLPSMLRLVTLTSALVASMSASSVLSLLQDSYMFSSQGSHGPSLEYACSSVFGVSICHGPGVSYQFQAMAAGLASFSAIISLVLFLTNRILVQTPSEVIAPAGATLVYIEEREEPLLLAEQGAVPQARVVG